ncbi:hypothetical protein [Arachidicoccus sp.]|uniref:hypothetical protein n=1 Tax=Arachidicoccus sp. TaxID=1872624 RepID=UPI003D220826
MRTNKIILFLVASTVFFWGCQKIIHGYLSDRIFYQVNPFNVLQGVTTVSSSLVADGSTEPLHVKVLSLTDSSGKDADSLLTTPQNIVTYKGTVTYLDSTIDMLKAKLSDSMVRPFNIAEIGGRLQFTAATVYVPAGKYNMNIEVSNVRGTREINNACEINIVPIITDSIFYEGVTTSDILGNFYPSSMNVIITRVPKGANKVIFKFLDKNGKPFDPANAEVVHRKGRSNFADWDPYYPEVKTDSSLEYEYPSGVPQFPIFSSTVIDDGSSWNGGISYYQIPWKYTSNGLNVNPVLTPIFYQPNGTYIITYYLNDIEHK